MKKVILIILLSIFALNCSKDTNSSNPNVDDQEQTDNENDGNENQDSNESSDNLNIDINLQLSGLPLEIFEVQIADLPGTVQDYNIEMGDVEIPIHNLTNSQFEFVAPYNLSPNSYEISLNYLDKKYAIGTLTIKDIKEVNPTGFVYIENDDEELPFILMDSLNSIIVPKIKNGQLVGTIINTDNGDEIYLEFNEYYLPTFARINSTNIIIDNYEADVSNVNIAYYEDDNPSEIESVKDVPIDSSIIEYAIELKNDSGKTDIGDALKVLQGIGVGISAFRCILGIVTIGSGGALLAGYECLNVAVALVEFAASQEDGLVANSIRLKALLGLKKCRDVLRLNISPAEVFEAFDDCKSGLITSATLIASLFEDKKEENLDTNIDARNDTCEIACGGIFDPNDESTWLARRELLIGGVQMHSSNQSGYSVQLSLKDDGSVIGPGGATGSWTYNGKSLTINWTRSFSIPDLDENNSPIEVPCTISGSFSGSLVNYTTADGSGSNSSSCCDENNCGLQFWNGPARVSF